jgi:hypothetical protein
MLDPGTSSYGHCTYRLGIPAVLWAGRAAVLEQRHLPPVQMVCPSEHVNVLV